MKTLILSLFSVNLLSIFNLVYGAISQDCINLNSFLGRSQDKECCDGKLAICDGDGYFTRLNL